VDGSYHLRGAMIAPVVTVLPLNRKENIQRKERIRKREDFERLLKSGKRYYSRQYTVIVAPSHFDHVRIGLSIGKRVGNAVCRNYEKRVCREFFRREKHWCKKGNDILIIIKKQTEDFQSSYSTLKKLFHQCFG
jgi:ribonuclease P protein component